MASRPFVEDIFKLPPQGQGQWIQIYTGQEIIQDPYENNKIIEYNNPLPIIAIVTDLSTSAADWKMPGIMVKKIKEIFVHKENRDLIELSEAIEIDGDMYEGWRINGKFQIREMAGNVLRLYVYIALS